MANERYDQKPAGTVTPAKILLLADPSTGALEKVTVEQLLGYQVYVALLTQSSTDAPVPVVLQNTIPGVMTWGYDDAGQYTLNNSLGFTAIKTAIFINNAKVGTALGLVAAYLDSNVIVRTFSDLTTKANDVLSEYPITIEVRVYP